MLTDKLKNRRLILCSASARRNELLKGIDIPFEIDVLNNFDESYPPSTPTQLIPEAIAKGKSHSFHRELHDDEILITADTLVVCEDKILGKPKGRDEAITMLNLLSGKNHQVITGVCIRSNKKEKSFSSSSFVTFRILNRDEIEYYVDNYQPYDKAGAYGIQEWIGFIGITSIKGSFYNIMGLPIQKLYGKLFNF
jgi:septum formation protein